ncbi:hypothetical protein C8K15_10686 [Paenisporosarcina sp. OV554]|nr:hypothetical protein C8K15_10686 [Paenisporosarcina sp. OV554]
MFNIYSLEIIQNRIQSVFTIEVHWLPDNQSLEFAMEPNAVFKHVSEFIDFLNAGMPNES